ncbi:FMN-dependent NADH-azoreductase [Luteibacter sahnii]|uniref:FMN-dependent NADH-azoreductase n=1 Tax=Luteibacter sahnii TaxID=3021977 RepID=UPI002A6AF79C|nr:FMN-dependent NADH-azoreductase [Luteibacter sp. PPL193]MDY1547087.1 FMN-dependent NADH-azoreductase [Luteibacter sp. PPL193]
MQLLHLDSSILRDASVSRALSAAVVDTARLRHPGIVVVYRDLVADPVPHLDGAIAAGFRPVAGNDADSVTHAEHERSRSLVDEFLASDLIVIGAPMYNFSVSTQLKAWIDRIAQPGKTFQYTAQGPVGLAAGKRVIVASTRGGMYSAGPAAAMDFQEAYLKAMFGFLGIIDVTFVRAEQLSRGDELRAQSICDAHAAIDADCFLASH